jgi:hypothetical protein
MKKKMEIENYLPRFCCTAFLSKIENAGKSGISFLARSCDNKRFMIQSRGVDSDLEESAAKCAVKINLVSEQVIRFCPFCGFHLGDWIKDNETEFDHLAQLHKTFIISS